MTNELIINGPQLAGAAAVACSDLLGCWLRIGWCLVFIAWLIVFVLWVRQLGVYNRTYRKYQQACREYEQAHGKPSEELRLLQERLRNINENPCMTLKLLRRFGLIVGQSNIKCDSGKIKYLGGIESRSKVDKLLNVSRSGTKKKLFNFFAVVGSCKFSSFLRRHKYDVVKQANDSNSATPDVRCQPRMRN